MAVYYNEVDPGAAEWLRQLIKLGEIADGYVDERSILDVQPEDLKGYTQWHFFAGIGVWSHALRKAGWPDDRPVLTGSCPCQPFSVAGLQKGLDDERNLWPELMRLITAVKPPTVMGEQVASTPVVGKSNSQGCRPFPLQETLDDWQITTLLTAEGSLDEAVDATNSTAWFDHVQADLEEAGYAVAAIPFPACGVGAPHIRDRLYWVGHAECSGLERLGGTDDGKEGRQEPSRPSAETGTTSELADTAGHRREREGASTEVEERSAEGPDVRGQLPRGLEGCGMAGEQQAAVCPARERPTGPTNGLWGAADWLFCRDGKWRPVEPGTFPLVNGSPSELVPSSNLSESDVEATQEARKVRLKGYGNALCAPAAIEFIGGLITVIGESGD